MKNETVSLEVAIEVVLRNGPTFETIAGLCKMAVEAVKAGQPCPTCAALSKDFEELVRADERNSWPSEMEAMERQVNILTDALAKSKADEREACAKVCDDLPPPDGYNMTEISFWDVTSLECAAAIRARSET